MTLTPTQTAKILGSKPPIKVKSVWHGFMLWLSRKSK